MLVADEPRRFRHQDPKYVYFLHIHKLVQRRSKRRKKSYSLKTDFLINLFNSQDGLCAITGLPMTLITDCSDSYYHTHNASVDRIDNSRGYEPDNVQLTCQQVNIMRGSLGIEEFKRFCREIVNNLDLQWKK